ncbi:MAG: tRNA (adenosine(37)-N6)-threonylcarbamoyltransferase complex dimerization subunit type 1 TsaB [bacterium]
MGVYSTIRAKGICLGLETSGSGTGVALVCDGSVVFEINTHRNHCPTDEKGGCRVTHNENLLLFIAVALGQAGLKPDSLDAIFLTIGPGMFTSLRVGLSVAKGLALPRNLPVKGINTLLALSMTAAEYTNLKAYPTQIRDKVIGPVLSLIDARKGELYAGLFQGEKALIEPLVISPEGLTELLYRVHLPGQGLIIAGDGAAIAEPLLKEAGFSLCKSGRVFPSPVTVVQLGASLMEKDGPDDLVSLEPVYLRRTDAELRRI